MLSLIRSQQAWRLALGEEVRQAGALRFVIISLPWRVCCGYGDLEIPTSHERSRKLTWLQLAGEFGLRNKREIWRIQLTLSKVSIVLHPLADPALTQWGQIRRAARELLKLDDKDPKRLFEGNALIRRLVRIGVLTDDRMRLDYVLALKPEDFLERRLQTQVFKLG